MVEEMRAADAWGLLADDPAAVLVDVRTKAEWREVGVPDLALLERNAVFVSWALPPAGAVNPRFLEEMAQAGVRGDETVVFLCRSGVRSLHAAIASEAAGFDRVVNVVDGFEGPPDGRGRRGTVSGWQAAGLPWCR